MKHWKGVEDIDWEDPSLWKNGGVDVKMGATGFEFRVPNHTVKNLLAEIEIKNDRIAKFKRQVNQLMERCEKAEKQGDIVLVKRTWAELQAGDFIAYYFETDSPVWRAEKRELLNENGVSIDVLEKLAEITDGGEE